MYNRAVTDARKYGLVAVFLLALLGLTLTAPTSVAACLCGAVPPDERVLGPDDVVFTGTAIGAAPRRGNLADSMIYTFAVENVEHGDPRDGRVYVRSRQSGACGLEMHLGASYLVDAQVVDPDAPFMQEAPTVPLVTGLCSGTAQLSPPNPLFMVRALGTPGLVVALGGLALVAGAGVYAWRRRDSGVGQ